MDHVTIDLRNYELQQEEAERRWNENAEMILEERFNQELKDMLAEPGEIYAEMDRQDLIADLFCDISSVVQAIENNTYIGNALMLIRDVYVKTAKEMVIDRMMNDYEEKYRGFLEGL